MSSRSSGNSAVRAHETGARSPGSGAHRAAKAPGDSRARAAVQDYLDRFATAMTAGDTKTMIQLWGVPAFVVGDQMARAVQSESEVEQFFSGTKQAYNARGIVDTRAEIVDLDWISESSVIATVRWPYLDQDGNETGHESSSYTLLRGEDGSFKVRVVTLRGAQGEWADLAAMPEDTDE